MQTVLTVLHLLFALGLVGLVLIQHGKGADAGAAFGSGASATVFGARGSANFLSRATAVVAVAFFVTSLALAYFAMQTGREGGLMLESESVAPAAPIDTATDTASGSGDTPAPPTDVMDNALPSDLPEAPE